MQHTESLWRGVSENMMEATSLRARGGPPLHPITPGLVERYLVSSTSPITNTFAMADPQARLQQLSEDFKKLQAGE
jgi:hypothetical protein